MAVFRIAVTEVERRVWMALTIGFVDRTGGRETPSADPQFWAAFVLLGDPD